MSRKLHALLVGIDTYPNVPQLQGCVADARAIDHFLQTHCQDQLAEPPKLLLNADATRQGIIDTFRAHLGKAQAGDTAYFHFSGHGSREEAPEAFHPFFPEKKNETLVCYDSRAPQGLDLADKELAVLIAEVAQAGKVHVVVTLDNCHAGSGTRSTPKLLAGARQTQAEGNPRSLDSYLGGYYQKMLEEEGKLRLPVASHVVLSACLPSERAYETTQQRGLFSTALVEVLERHQGNINYEDLFEQVRAQVRQTGKQTPVFSFYGNARACDYFLTQTPSEGSPLYNVYFDPTLQAWKTHNGALQGIPTESVEQIRFQIFEANASTFGASQMLVELTAREVRQDATILTADQTQTLDPAQTYMGLVASLPPAKLKLHSGLSEEENQAVVPEFLFTLVSEKADAHYLIDKIRGKYQISAQLTGNPVATKNEASFAKDMLVKIAHWENTRQLAHPQTKLLPDDLEVAIYLTDEAGNPRKNENGQEKLLPEKDTDEFSFDLGNQAYVGCKYEVTNHTHTDLYVTSLIISPLGGVIRMNEKRIPRGASTSMNTLWDDGTEDDVDSIVFLPGMPAEATECVVQVKYLASTLEYIDVSRLVQGDFSEGALRGEVDSQDVSLSRFGGAPNRQRQAESSDDWFARDVFFRVTRGGQAIEGGKPQALKDTDIKISPPEGFKAKVLLGNVTNGTRGISSRDYLLNGLVNEAEGASLFSWGKTSRSTQSHDLIELSDIEGTLSAEHPLELEMPTNLTAQDWLIPVTFDGEHLLPIGFGEVSSTGQAKVTIERLPEEQTKSRSVGRALKFALYKLSSKVFKIPEASFHQLRAVEYLNEAGKFVYDDDPTTIAAKVKASSKDILLIIHGIIGNTEGMAEFAAPLVQNKERYDLVLAYDYENLSTSIVDISFQLKKALAQVGIGTEGNKKIEVLAHSMGGLVSRWLIEQKEGNLFVDRLVMCGTPNAGSLFGKIDACLKYASIGLAIGLNLLSPWKTVAKIAAWITGLKVARSAAGVGSKLTRTLEDMTPDSSFMKNLNEDGRNGNIPYTIFAGDIQTYSQKPRPLLDKILKVVGNIVNSQAPNDLAVKVDSIKSQGKNTEVKTFDVACHHLNYFTEPTCAKLLMEWLEQE